MSSGGKILPAGAEVSAVEAGADVLAAESERPKVFVSLLKLVLCNKMRDLALHGTRWHTPCDCGHPGESA